MIKLKQINQNESVRLIEDEKVYIEAWIGEKYQILEKKMFEAGVTVLHDRAVKLTKNNEIIQIAGLDDSYFIDGDSYMKESIMKSNLDKMDLTDEYCILLSHRPEIFETYVSENIDLVLSGHAHGGQFRLPFIGGVVAPNKGIFPRYDSGKYSKNNTTMIVSRGIGNSIIPVRFNNRPKIVVIELLRK